MIQIPSGTDFYYRTWFLDVDQQVSEPDRPKRVTGRRLEVALVTGNAKDARVF